jgi:hypothetical protein
MNEAVNMNEVSSAAPLMQEQLTFEIIDAGLEMPRSKRGNRNGVGGGVKYPIEKLEIGQSFFVAKTERMPDPIKTMGSAITAAKAKFATQVGTESVTRSKRGEKNKLVLDENGHKIMETKMVPVYDYARQWILRSVVAGQVCGSGTGAWKAPYDGALVQRIK